ncbi:MAG: amino acid permease [Planctomycetota bacterium]
MADSPKGKRSQEPERTLGLPSATGIVAASMIGTGIFTVSGEVAETTSTGWGLLVAWTLGGLYALCGALCYAELAAALPRSGGESFYLGHIYHPLLGFLAGWISLIAGFSAPIALSSLAFGKYLGALIPGIDEALAATGLVLFLSLLHATNVHRAVRLQTALAAAKVLLILVFIAGGLLLSGGRSIDLGTLSGLQADLLHASFAIALIQIVFAYSGWNAATYVAGEVRSPTRTLPRSLLGGTMLVTVLYVGLNVIFLLALPLSQMKGVVEVGDVAARRLFGEAAGSALSIGITLALVSSVSAMIMSGPRVYREMGVQVPLLSFIRGLNRHGAPTRAVALQGFIAVAMIWISDFRELLFYIGFTLSLCAAFTVLGQMILRVRRPDLERPYRTTLYPLPPLLFLGFTAWMVFDGVRGNGDGVLQAGLTILLGATVYFADRWVSRRWRRETPD